MKNRFGLLALAFEFICILSISGIASVVTFDYGVNTKKFEVITDTISKKEIDDSSKYETPILMVWRDPKTNQLQSRQLTDTTP